MSETRPSPSKKRPSPSKEQPSPSNKRPSPSRKQPTPDATSRDGIQPKRQGTSTLKRSTANLPRTPITSCRTIEDELRFEFERRVFVDVAGFLDAVFPQVPRGVLEKMGAFQSGNWAGWPGATAKEWKRAKFWFGLQTKLLKILNELSCVPKPTCRYKDCRSVMVGHDTGEQHKPDVVVVPLNDPQEQSNFSRVICAGEFKAPKNARNGFLQVARYARAIFYHHPTLNFVHAFVLEGSKMRNWIFNRSGAYSGPLIDINAKKKEFLRVFYGYLTMDRAQQGYEPAIADEGDLFMLSLKSGVRVSLERTPIVRKHAIVCRGTTCFVGEFDSDKKKCLVKIAWRQEEGSEAVFFEEAAQFGIPHLARLVYSQKLTSTSELQKGLELRTPRDINLTPLQQLEQPEQLPKDEGWHDRVCYVMIMEPLGKPLDKFSSARELVQGMRDAIEAHYDLYTKAKILHRDISQGNIILSEGRGWLTDLDHSVFYEEGQGKYDLTGTWPYLAIGLLDTKPRVHAYRHDLESFFYVLIWACYGPENTKQLVDWHNGSMKQMRAAKVEFVSEPVENMCEWFMPQVDLPAMRDLVDGVRAALFYTNYGGLAPNVYPPYFGEPKQIGQLYRAVIDAYDRALTVLLANGEQQTKIPAVPPFPT